MSKLDKKIREQIDELLCQRGIVEAAGFVERVFDRTFEKVEEKLTAALAEIVVDAFFECLDEVLGKFGRAVPCKHACLLGKRVDDHCELPRHKLPKDCLTCEDYEPRE